MFKINSWSHGKFHTQEIDDGRFVYDIPSVIFQSRFLVPFEIPLMGMCIDYRIDSEPLRIIGFVEHMKGVLEADLTKPIILDREGWVIDGRHRIARALLENKQTILAVRFEKNPNYKCLSKD